MKKKINSWIKNIEFIFTQEKLDEFVREGYLERIKKNNRFHYIKKGCINWFNPDAFKDIEIA